MNRIQNKLKFDLNLIEKKLAHALTKMTRFRKTLIYTKSKIAEKIFCFAQELSANNVETKNEVFSDLSQFIKKLFDDF